MIFKHINVVLEPWELSSGDSLRLRVTMATLEHGEFGTEQILPKDHLVSDFDRIWEYIGRELKQELEKNDGRGRRASV